MICSDFKDIDPNSAKYWENCPTDAAPNGLGCLRNDQARHARMRCTEAPSMNTLVTEPFKENMNHEPPPPEPRPPIQP